MIKKRAKEDYTDDLFIMDQRDVSSKIFIMYMYIIYYICIYIYNLKRFLYSFIKSITIANIRLTQAKFTQ